MENLDPFFLNDRKMLRSHATTLSSTASIGRELTLAPRNFLIETIYQGGSTKAHNPLMLGKRWMVQPIPDGLRSNDVSYQLILRDTISGESKTIAYVMYMVNLVALSENSFAALYREDYDGPANSIFRISK